MPHPDLKTPQTTMPCPDWCSLPAGHSYDSLTNEGLLLRFHETASRGTDAVSIILAAEETATTDQVAGGRPRGTEGSPARGRRAARADPAHRTGTAPARRDPARCRGRVGPNQCEVADPVEGPVVSRRPGPLHVYPGGP